MTFAYWCVVIAMVLPWICAAYAKKKGGFAGQDNHNPREFLEHTQGAAKRANAAQQNGYEIFAPFAAAVIIANITGNADSFWIGTWAFLFVLSRIAFIYCYIKDLSSMRSIAWGLGLLCILILYAIAI